MVREARRRVGMSQRAFAASAGVAPSTVAAVEAGRHEPSLPVLRALLAVADLELTLDCTVPDLCNHVLRHLRLSLSVRLHLALGGSGRPWTPPRLPAWEQLNVVARRARACLRGDVARGLWLPGAVGVPPLVEVPPGTAQRLPSTPDLRVREARVDDACTVSVSLVTGAACTPAPGELALDPAQAEWRRSLRSVAAALDAQAPRDEQGRRTPAHFEPRREEEVWRLLFARRWNQRLRPPDPLDARGWRLGDEASMNEWIERRSGRG